jgi:hypothetical protein
VQIPINELLNGISSGRYNFRDFPELQYDPETRIRFLEVIQLVCDESISYHERVQKLAARLEALGSDHPELEKRRQELEELKVLADRQAATVVKLYTARDRIQANWERQDAATSAQRIERLRDHAAFEQKVLEEGAKLAREGRLTQKDLGEVLGLGKGDSAATLFARAIKRHELDWPKLKGEIKAQTERSSIPVEDSKVKV